MTNLKLTRRALISSALALFLCFAMLLGTTFAWFTDSVTSGSNIIQSGTLNVEMYYADGTAEVPADDSSDWKNANGATIYTADQLWEPGYTDAKHVMIANEGSLALKYQLAIIPEGEVSKLAEVIDVYYIEGATQISSRADLENYTPIGTLSDLINNGIKQGTLSANTSYTATIVLVMQTSAGNEYQKLSIGDGFTIQLLATQYTEETDSFDDDYDEDAWVEGMNVYNASDLQAAISAGEDVVLMNDITITKAIEIPASAASTFSLNSTAPAIVIDLNGNDIIIEAEYDSNDSLASSAIVNYGNVVLTGEGVIKATNNYTVRNYGTMLINGITVENGIMNFADLTVDSGNISNSRSGKHTIYGNGASLTINGGTFYNDNPGNAAIFSYAGEVTINGGEFSIADGTATLGWTSCLIDAQGNAKYTINGGVINGEIRDYNKNTVVNGGTFSHKSFQNFLGANVIYLDNGNGTWVAYANDSSSKMVMPNGAVLDLKGVEFLGTVVAEGDLTIKGDTKIKTLSAKKGGIITIEDGKTLTLNNFSFGSADTAGSEYTIKGGTINASYGFFQHGTYALYSNFETGYMYYSYGSDITVYGTFHSQGKGDGLDYVRGKLTIANGGQSIHDKSLWVGQPAGWGAMSASLTVEEGGYVQANSLSVYEGSVAYNSAANLGKENVGVKYNTLNGKIDVVCSNADQLTNAIAVGGTFVLTDDIDMGSTKLTVAKDLVLDLNGHTVSGICEENQSYLFMVKNGATMDIYDYSAAQTGKITYAQGTAIYGWTIDLEGQLNLHSGTIELTGDAWDIGYAVDVRPNAWGTNYTEDTVFTMNGGKIVSSFDGIRVASSSSDSYTNIVAKFVMNGGEIDAARDGIFMQQSNAAYDTLTVEINDGVVKGTRPIRVYGPVATSVNAGTAKPMTITAKAASLVLVGALDTGYTWHTEGKIAYKGGMTLDNLNQYSTITLN